MTGDAPSKQQICKKSKYPNKSNSLLSLNVPSLTKFLKMSGSTPDIIKKSVSESHVGQVDAASELCKSVTQNLSQVQSSENFENKSHEIDPSKKIITEDALQTKLEVNCERNIVKHAEEQNLLAKIQPKLRVLVSRSECENIEDASVKIEHEE